VVRIETGGHRLDGSGPITEVANRFLAHLEIRGFAPGTVRAYAFDLLNFSRFLDTRNASLADVVATDLFDYLGWQQEQRPANKGNVVNNPVPAARRSAGLRPKARGMLGHIGRAERQPGVAWCANPVAYLRAWSTPR
jgi:hypothetical protein